MVLDVLNAAVRASRHGARDQLIVVLGFPEEERGARGASATASITEISGPVELPLIDAPLQAVEIWFADSSPSSAIDVSRILNFCTLPVTVIGKSGVTRT